MPVVKARPTEPRKSHLVHGRLAHCAHANGMGKSLWLSDQCLLRLENPKRKECLEDRVVKSWEISKYRIPRFKLYNYQKCDMSYQKNAALDLSNYDALNAILSDMPILSAVPP